MHRRRSNATIWIWRCRCWTHPKKTTNDCFQKSGKLSPNGSSGPRESGDYVDSDWWPACSLQPCRRSQPCGLIPSVTTLWMLRPPLPASETLPKTHASRQNSMLQRHCGSRTSQKMNDNSRKTANRKHSRPKRLPARNQKKRNICWSSPIATLTARTCC